MAAPAADGMEASFPSIPEPVAWVLERVMAQGHEAALVGGCVRDLLLNTPPDDWDVATSAPPDVVAQLFPAATWENPFGTVTVRAGPEPMAIEVTTYRIEAAYRDRRRPDSVRWGDSLVDDLGRRDFTINAIGWVPVDMSARSGRIVDPHGGARDLDAKLLRAVGDPDARLAEDALRLVRAARFATRFGLRLEPATEAAIRRNTSLAASLSGERVRDELFRILGTSAAAQPPSAAFLLMERLGMLEPVVPELAALRGIPQAKALPGDALEHSLRTADALPADDPLLRMVGLLHDIGKSTTLGEGHFIGHEQVGADLAQATLRRLRLPRRAIDRAVHLIRNHMFVYRPDWTDAAVRRFVRRVGPAALADLFVLREADNAASGVREPTRGGLSELRERANDELARTVFSTRQLALGGEDLIGVLGAPPGPVIGRLLARLLEAVVEDPTRNDRAALLELAGSWLPEESSVPERPRRRSVAVVHSRTG
jgi:tRNA nucleotidyltransferase (CCA-adding enzyme)